ncbi:MAG: hypothetical protein ACLTCP_09030 [Ruminococcus bicirculans (ex Wegman et al. 2014)]
MLLPFVAEDLRNTSGIVIVRKMLKVYVLNQKVKDRELKSFILRDRWHTKGKVCGSRLIIRKRRQKPQGRQEI